MDNKDVDIYRNELQLITDRIIVEEHQIATKKITEDHFQLLIGTLLDAEKSTIIKIVERNTLDNMKNRHKKRKKWWTTELKMLKVEVDK